MGALAGVSKETMFTVRLDLIWNGTQKRAWSEWLTSVWCLCHRNALTAYWTLTPSPKQLCEVIQNDLTQMSNANKMHVWPDCDASVRIHRRNEKFKKAHHSDWRYRLCCWCSRCWCWLAAVEQHQRPSTDTWQSWLQSKRCWGTLTTWWKPKMIPNAALPRVT